MGKRLILVPQYPTKLRYQEWWFTSFEYEFKKYFDEVIVLGKNCVRAKGTQQKDFAPEEAINFEVNQIREYLHLDLKKGDVLLLNDLSYPGLFSQILIHKRPDKCYAICHATSKNAFDIFAKLRTIKYPIEKASSRLFDGIFVATEYHKSKLNWTNMHVVALPEPDLRKWGLYQLPHEKEYNVVRVSRPTKQKYTALLEKKITSVLGIQIKTPPNIKTWDGYYLFLSKSKVLFISSKEETYGYQVIDAIKANCIPIAPRGFSYKELLPDKYLYSSIDDALSKVASALSGGLKPLAHHNLFDKANEFYLTVAKIMLQ